MNLFDSAKKSMKEKADQISALRSQAEDLDNYRLCKFLQEGNTFGLAGGSVLKDRLYDMSGSEMKDLFDYCRNEQFTVAARIIRQFAEANR